MNEYRNSGKQVLLDGSHFADAVDEVAAMMIAKALNKRRARTKPSHHYHRQGDEYACSCGLRWDVGERDPHRATA